MRSLLAVGLGYLVLCGHTLWSHRAPPPPVPQRASSSPARCATPGLGSPEARKWFCDVKPNCNSLEVTARVQQQPPPAGWDGAGYAAACFALAGRIDDARARLGASDRAPQSSQILFEISHPVADRGDDLSSGPMMDLVLEFWPENFQAMYHAGMSAYGQKDFVKAKAQLERFREMYKNEDFFGQNAKRALERMGQGLGPESPNPGAH
ncbi:MAG: hypothetical protein HY791_18635 [Deltaproteobacteria bacterium]|nr:hypothetical protein [Deltaproteobacteria bacterium]